MNKRNNLILVTILGISLNCLGAAAPKSASSEQFTEELMMQIQEKIDKIAIEVGKIVSKEDLDRELLSAVMFGKYNSAFPTSVIECCVKVGANPKQVDEKGLTLVHYTCSNYCELETLVYLVDTLKLGVDQLDNKGRTALHLTVNEFHEGTNVDLQLSKVKFLVSRGANVFAKDANGKTPLDYCWNDHKEFMPTLQPIAEFLQKEMKIENVVVV